MEKDEFEKYIERYQDDMFRFAKSIVGNSVDGEDAVQEAVIKAYQKVDNLRSKDKFKAWIFCILSHECYKILNKRNRQELTETGEIPEQIVNETREESGVWEQLEQIPKKYREVMILYYGDEFSVWEIAGIIGIPVGTVKSRLSRGRKELRRRLEERGCKYARQV